MIEKIYKQLRKLEQQGPPWPLEQLQLLKNFFSEIPDPKLADLSKHLQLDMSMMHLQNLLVPFERILQKSILETKFLVQNQDHLQSQQEPLPMIFILENIRSSFNVGSIFRTADALGVAEIYLTGYTPTPDDETIKKTALGAEDFCVWKFFTTTEEAIQSAKQKNYRTVALETAPQSQAMDESLPAQPTAFIFGNERFGLNPLTINQCDEIRHIPMRGRKNSLNIAVCAGLVAHAFSQNYLKKSKG